MAQNSSPEAADFPEADLPPQVCELATKLRHACRRLGRVARSSYDMLDAGDYVHTSQVAVWEAWWALNQKQGQVDWVEEEESILALAKRYLSRMVQGAETIHGDMRARSSVVPRSRQKAGRFNALRRIPVCEMWAIWRQVEPSSPNQARVFIAASDFQPQEEALRRSTLAGLRAALAEVLTERELWLIEEHYLKGRKQREIAMEMAATMPQYAPKYEGDESGWRRAENLINVTLKRAKARAAERLAPMWQQLLEPA